ncbi:MAG: hypothetical protein RQ867_10120 [Mariprofundaceae bacterium]|nr:hypothetical protein [Mariprofundaceae bacterium]
MDWELLLLMLPIAVFLWWAGFAATKRMRVGKNREREERARQLLAEKAAHEESGPKSTEQESN